MRAGFNGAAVIRPRKVGSHPHCHPPSGRFNGAAVIRPRKVVDSQQMVEVIVRLQWGRGHSTAESHAAGHLDGTAQCFNGAAVIRPRKDRRILGEIVFWNGFNGAAVIRPRKA